MKFKLYLVTVDMNNQTDWLTFWETIFAIQDLTLLQMDYLDQQ